MNVVIGGPSNSGKTCLRESLRLSIYRQSKIYPLYVPANTDGEGNWFRYAAMQNPELARRNRDRGPKLDGPVIRRICDALENSNAPLRLIDLGGEPTSEDEQFIEATGPDSFRILLFHPNADLKNWTRLLGDGKFVALQSELDAHSQWFGLQKTSIIGGLDRARRPDPGDPVVYQLAGAILNRLHHMNLSELIPSQQNALEIDCFPNDEDGKEVLVSTQLDPQRTTNTEVVRHVLEHSLNLPNTSWKTCEDVLVNGPITMAAAVALCFRLRDLTSARIHMFDPDTGVYLDVTPSTSDQLAMPASNLLNLQTILTGDVLTVTCRLLNHSRTKGELLSAALAMAGRIPDRERNSMRTLRLNGRSAIAVACATSLALASPNLTNVQVFDPALGAEGSYLEVWSREGTAQ